MTSKVVTPEEDKDEVIKKLLADKKRLEQELKEARNEADGWLVTTPSPVYNGTTMGIRFINGAAFIRRNSDFPQMAIKPTKDTTFDKMGLTQAERQAIREREKRPTSERLVQQLVDDYGYKAEWYTEADARKLQDALANRENMARAEVARMKESGETVARGLVKPQAFADV